MTRHRVMIVEDHAVVREGLRALLAAVPGLEVVEEASNGRDAVQRAAALKPDLILMDVSMPGMNGLETMREIKRRFDEARFLILTVHRSEEYVSASLKAGAKGYVLKDASRAEILTAVRVVLEGKTYLSTDVVDKVVTGFLSGQSGAPASMSRLEKLTDRERQVLKLVAEGRTNKEAAEYLHVSIKTVEKHRATLMRKLNIQRAAALVAFAIEQDLIDA